MVTDLLFSIEQTTHGLIAVSATRRSLLTRKYSCKRFKKLMIGRFGDTPFFFFNCRAAAITAAKHLLAN